MLISHTDFVTRALELVLYLLPHAKSGREHYIREKLNTRNPSRAEADPCRAMTEKGFSGCALRGPRILT